MLNRKIIILFTLLLNTFIAFAQSGGLSGLTPEKLFQEDLSNKLSKDLLSKTDVLPVGNIVVPENYYVGPGDAISIQNLTASVNNEITMVSSESTLMIPRIGEVDLLGKTLAETKKIIIDEMKKRNPNAIVFVSLYQPRTVLVTLRGDIIKPGAYSMPASYRVSTAIKVASLLQNQSSGGRMQSQTELIFKERKRELEKNLSKAGMPGISIYSSRNISLIHLNGEAVNCDLEKAFAMNDPKYDPYVREGDEIIIPFNKENYQQISISGAVLRPSNVPWKQGDKASFLLKLAGGLSDDADVENVYLISPQNGEKTKLAVDANLKLLGQDFDLQAGSAIIVTQKNPDESEESGTVAITGEVKYPGTFIITNDKTKIKDVIEKAGGFKADAYLPMSYILRKIDQNLESLNPNGEFFEYFQRSDLSMQDTTRITWDILYRKPYVACDFEALYEQKSEAQNVTLKNGDMIVIPPNPKTVFVYGQVNNPGYIPFEKGKPAEWYIEKAGGYATGAEIKNTRIIRAKNKIWYQVKKESRIYAGDEIYIPKPPDVPPGTELQQYFLFATAVGTLIQITYLIINVFQK